MTVKLPDQLRSKVASFGESSYGAYRVTLVLIDGRKVHNVVLAWGDEVDRVGSRIVESPDDLAFDVDDVTDVLPGWGAFNLRSPYVALALVTGTLTVISLVVCLRLGAAGIPLMESLVGDWSQLAFSSLLGLSLAVSIYRRESLKTPEPVWWRLFIWTAAIVLAVEVPVVWAMSAPQVPSSQLVAVASSALLTSPVLVTALLGVLRERRAALVTSNKGIEQNARR